MQRVFTFNNIRQYIESCRNGENIISIHNREEFDWNLSDCLDYLNNALSEDPHIGHILAYYVGYDYNNQSLRGKLYSSDIPESRIIIGEDTGIIDLDLENSKDVIPFNPSNKGFIKDGRHKTQLFIWLCYGCYVKFKGKTPIRFYQTFTIDEDDMGLVLKDERITAHANEKTWIYNRKNKSLSILYSCYDQMMYPTLKRNLLPYIDNCLSENKIGIANLNTTLYTRIVEYASKGLLYASLGEIYDKVVIQEDNISGYSDAMISSFTRNMQKGKEWTNYEIFKNHAECGLQQTGFKQMIKEITDDFVELGIQDYNTSQFQLDLVRFIYTFTFGKTIADEAIKKECDNDNDNIKYVILNLRLLSEFARNVYTSCKRVSVLFALRTYMRNLSLPFSIMHHLKDKSTAFERGDWVTNINVKYICKLMLKLVFKLHPQIGDRNEVGKILLSIWDDESRGVVSNEFGIREYNYIDNKILSACPEAFNWNTITIEDLFATDVNRKQFFSFMFGMPPDQYDIDHSCSKHESQLYYNRNSIPEDEEEYNTLWKDSIYNLKPLHHHTNRSSSGKGNKTQYEYYIECGLETAGENLGIDVQGVRNKLSPLQQAKANKAVFDRMIKRRFSMFAFEDRELDLTYPYQEQCLQV